MRQLISRLLRSSAKYAEISEGNEFTHKLDELRSVEDADIDIVIIHELTESADVAWKSEDVSSCWPAELPASDFDQARVMSFSYSYKDLKSLGDLVDAEKLRECAVALLGHYPLNPEFKITGADGSDTPDNRSNGINVDISKPVIFMAHGFGGLIYEMALTMSFQSESKPKTWRKHAVLLLDTPHHGAGMADWAIICAKRLGIPCASTPQKQKWTLLASQLEEIERMQRDFRVVIREKINIDIYGCFAMKLMPGNHLRIAPEWSVLPDFHVLGVEQSHFGMTRIKQGSTDFVNYCTTLSEQVRKLVVKETPSNTAPLDRPAPKKRSLLIASPFKALRGPLNDVASMEAFLTSQGFSISQCYDQNATRSNILVAWDSLIESISSSDDTIMIYFSGYGGIVQEPKDSKRGEQHEPRRYQYLVPMDFDERRTEGNYTDSDKPFLGILDIEIAHLLSRTTQRTPNVTAIFDCSYSGHLTRAPTHPKTAMARNLPKLYHEQLSSHISYLQSERGYPAESHIQVKSNEHVVVIDAATTGETAWDELFDGKPMGALTNSLVSVLEAVCSDDTRCGVSWQMTMQRVRELVNLDFPRQNPRVVGPEKRILFSTQETNAILLQVGRIDEATNIGIIKAGRASGLRQDNLYTLMPLGEESVNESRKLGTARITEVTAFFSKAELSLIDVGHETLRKGVLGFLTEQGPVKWPISVPDDDDLQLREAVTKSRYLRPIDVGIDERFLASINCHGDTMALCTMQGVQIAHQQVSDDDSELWAKAVHELVEQAEQLAISQRLQTLMCDNQDEQLDHSLEITVKTGSRRNPGGVIEQNGHGSILEDSKVSVFLNNKGADTLYISAYFINAAGLFRPLSQYYSHNVATLSGHTTHDFSFNIIWTNDIPRSNPITEHLFFIITDSYNYFDYLDSREVIKMSNKEIKSSLEKRVFDLVTGAVRKTEQNILEKVCYDTRQISFQIEPRKPSVSNPEP